MPTNRRFIQIALASVAVTACVSGSLVAQGSTASATARSVSVAARIEGRLGEILNIRAVGAPVQLADGTVEQRYAVVANVAFTLATPDANRDEIRVAEGGTDRPVGEYLGTPGFHAEIRVRTAAVTPALVAVQPRAVPATPTLPSGSSDR